MNKLTEAEFKALGRPMTPAECRDTPRTKLGKSTAISALWTRTGRKDDSKAEHKFWCHLLIRRRAGEIFNLERQVVYEIIPAVVLGGKRRAARQVHRGHALERGRPARPRSSSLMSREP